jgi:hypothetical protein
MANSFTYKITGENELFTFNYSQVLDPAETISSASCVAITMNGTDTNPSAILSGSPVISGANVSQRVINGLNENTYRLEMTATTSYGNVYVAIGDLPVYTADSNLI